MLQDQRLQAPRAFDIVNDGRAGIAAEHIHGKQHQQTIRVDDFTRARDNAQAIAVTVECQAKIGIGLLHGEDQILQVVRIRWIGVMVREFAIHLAIQFLHVATDAGQHRRRNRACHAIATVHHHLEPVLDLDVIGDAGDVVIVDADDLQAARAFAQAVFGNARVEILDGAFGQGFATQHDLEAVVVGRVVASGDRNAGAGLQVIGGKVGQRCWCEANVDDIATGGAQAFDQRAGKLGSGQAAIATDDNLAQPAISRLAADSPPDLPGNIVGEGLAKYAADVVSAEYAAVDGNLAGDFLGLGGLGFRGLSNRACRFRSHGFLLPDRLGQGNFLCC